MVREQVTHVGASVYPLKDGVMTTPVSVRAKRVQSTQRRQRCLCVCARTYFCILLVGGGVEEPALHLSGRNDYHSSILAWMYLIAVSNFLIKIFFKKLAYSEA